MPLYELKYLNGRAASERVDALDIDEAETLARRRLLFHEPGFAIAVVRDGIELARVRQEPQLRAAREGYREGGL